MILSNSVSNNFQNLFKRILQISMFMRKNKVFQSFSNNYITINYPLQGWERILYIENHTQARIVLI